MAQLIEPFLSPLPDASLVLLTNVLGISTNWLILRYLAANLRSASSLAPSLEEEPREGHRIVFLSFMRDYASWKESGARFSLDLDAAMKGGQFVFIDGLSGLFIPPQDDVKKNTTSWRRKGHRTIRGATAASIRMELDAGIEEIASGDQRPILIVDHVDLLLAASGEEINVTVIEAMLLELREKLHATIISVAADEPLISAQTTTLERQHAAFVLSLAHQADLVIGLRALDTGAASDVSGVMRITRGGGAAEDSTAEEHEYLYFLRGDGGVKVFERGS